MAPRRTPEPSIIGLKLMAGLPSEDGITPIAPRLKPMDSVIAVVRLVVGRGNVNYRKDSGQRVLEIEEIEADLTDEETATIQGILDAARERRTGEIRMGEPFPGMDDVPPAPPQDADEWAEGRAPSGTAHPDREAAKNAGEERAAAAKATPIGEGRRRRR